jgi:hypothetical protein
MFLYLIVGGGASLQAQSNNNFPLKSLFGQPTSSTSNPSDSSPPPAMTSKPTSGKSARGVLASEKLSQNSQGICFQPGVGWMHIPHNVVDSAQRSSPVTGSSTNDLAPTSSMFQQPSGMHSTTSDQCPEDIVNSSSSYLMVHQLVNGGKIQPSGLNAQTENANFGTQDWLNANTIVNPAKAALPTRLSTGLNSSQSDSKHLTHGSGQSLPIDSVPEFEGRAYVSPIKLRRMMRNAPDMETRFKLRRLSEKQKEESSKYSKMHQSDKMKYRQFDDEKTKNKPALTLHY